MRRNLGLCRFFFRVESPFRDAAGEQIEGESEPEAVVAHEARGAPHAKEHCHGCGHGHEHASGARQAYEYAVPDECPYSGHGHRCGPGEKLCGRGHDFGPVGERLQYQMASEQIGRRKYGGYGATPPQQCGDEAAQGAVVAGSVEASAYGLAGVGEAVHEVAEEHEQLHEKGVGGKSDDTVACSGAREPYGDGNKTQRAQENIGVYAEIAAQPVAAQEGAQAETARPVAREQYTD